MRSNRPHQSWNYIGLTNKKSLSDLRKTLSTRFHDTLIFKSKEYPKFFEVYARGFQNLPEKSNPRGGFQMVSTRKSGEKLDREYLDHLVGVISQGMPNMHVDILVLPGPHFELIKETGRYKTNPEIEKVIWMRWYLKSVA